MSKVPQSKITPQGMSGLWNLQGYTGSSPQRRKDIKGLNNIMKEIDYKIYQGDGSAIKVGWR